MHSSLVALATGAFLVVAACASPAPLNTKEEIAADLQSACASVLSEYKATGLDAGTGKTVTEEKAMHYIAVVTDIIAARTSETEIQADLTRGEEYIASRRESVSLVSKAVVSEEKVSNCLRQRRLNQLAR